MINATGYRLKCDVCGWEAPELDNVNRFRLLGAAKALGWKFNRRKDGQYAGRGGKDYCPLCVADAGWTDVP